MDALSAVLAARAILEDVTPLARDCGRLCGARCCQADEDGRGGMLLFPGEQALYAGRAGFTLYGDDSVMPGMTLLVCDGHCDRKERPLACRVFPATPLLRENKLSVALDVRAWEVCPLMEMGARALSGAFMEAVREAARTLCKCPEHRAYLRALTRYLSEFSKL